MSRKPLSLVVLVALALGPAAFAQGVVSPTVPIQPSDYASPAGTCRLDVSPNRRDGSGSARYQMTCRGRVAWASQHPYTLLAPEVTDDGWAAGYAYTCAAERQLDSHARELEQQGTCDLQLATFEPGGKERVLHAEQARFWHFVYMFASPQAKGVVLDPRNDRVVFRVDYWGGSSPESWLPFRLSDGRALPHLRPRSDPSEANDAYREEIRAARAVPGTSLALVQFVRLLPWHRSGPSRFALLDVSGAVVWTMDTKEELGAAIVATTIPKTFAVRLNGGSQVVTFAVASDTAKPGSWTAHETARRPWIDATPAPLPPDPFATLPLIDARPLGEIVLTGYASLPFPHIRGVDEFEIDDRGRLAFLRRDGVDGVALVLVDENGELVREVRLPDAEGWFVSAWAGGDRWIVTSRNYPEFRLSKAFLVHADAGDVEELTTIPKGRIQSLRGRGGRGFAVVVELASPGAPGAATQKQVALFDRDGDLERTLERPDDDLILGVELSDGGSVRRDPNGIAVLDANRRIIRRFDPSRAAGHERASVHEVWPDSDGGFIAEVSDDGPVLYRMRPDGSVRAVVRPRHAEGHAINSLSSPQVDPKGRIWIRHGDALLRLGEDGRVEQTLGAEHDDPALGSITHAEIDRTGRIHAVDSRTASVHSFDSAGVQVARCTARQPIESQPDMVMGIDGELWVPDGEPNGASVRFVQCADGNPRTIPRVTPLHLQGAGSFWAKGVMELVLASNGTMRRIQRRPDGLWIESLGASAMAPDGALAVESPPANARPWEPRTISLYDRDGAPRRTITLPAAWAGRVFAYDGEHMFLWLSGEVRVLDAEGRAVQRIAVDVDGQAVSVIPQLAPGQEIWLIDRDGRRVYRFERPQTRRR